MKPIIHPTAIVNPSATIEPGVIIGPNVVIEDGVRIGAFSVIGGLPEHKDFYDDLNHERTKGVVIRRNARLFEFVTVHSGTRAPTFIGAHAAIFQKAHIAHDCDIWPFATIGGQATLAGHVVVMSGSIVSGKSALHQWCVIGQSAILGAASYLKAHIPPGEKWMGNPARPAGINEIGLQRAGFKFEELVQEPFQTLIKERKI